MSRQPRPRSSNDLPDFSTLAGQLSFYRQRESRRRGRTLTQDQAAREADISYSYLTKLERGERLHAAVEYLRALATVYHLSDKEWRSLRHYALRPTTSQWTLHRT